jgi:polyhydroxyalkanoate synthesis regulator phasin
MKVTIDFADFYVEEGEIASQLKREIIAEAITQIKKSIDAKINETIISVVKEMIDSELTLQVRDTVKTAMSGKLKWKVDYNKTEDLSISQIIESMFSSSSKKVTDDAKSIIERQVQKLSDEMKKRYDMTFAALIVSKMNEQGFLKEDVLKSITQA